MEENKEENENYKKLKCHYLLHIIIFIIILSTHVLIYFKVYWIKQIIGLLFIYFSLVEILYILIPGISLIFLRLRKQFKLKHLEILKKISILFLIISIAIGIFFSILVIINTIYGKVFRNECPFNLEEKFILSFSESFKVEEDNELKDKCQERICLLYDYKENDKYPYKYLCNYNSEKDFGEKLGNPYVRILSNGTELKTYSQIKCNIFGQFYIYDYNIQNNEIIYQFLDICYYLGDFYSCERFEEPKKYDISTLDECPGENYIFILGILCVYIIAADIIISFIPWSIENKSYNSLMETIEDYADINKNPTNINDANNRKINEDNNHKSNDGNDTKTNDDNEHKSNNDNNSKSNNYNNHKSNDDKANKNSEDKKIDEDDSDEDKKDDNDDNNGRINKSKNTLFATKFQSNYSEEVNSIKQKTKIIIKIDNIDKNMDSINEGGDENNDPNENINENNIKNNKENNGNNFDNNEAILYKKQSNINDNEKNENNDRINNEENDDNRSSNINGFSISEI